MTIEKTQITNISNNQSQVFIIDGYNMILDYSYNLQRWCVSIEDLVYNLIVAPNTTILEEYSLPFYLVSECDNDTGAKSTESFLTDGDSRLYIIREVVDG